MFSDYPTSVVLISFRLIKALEYIFVRYLGFRVDRYNIMRNLCQNNHQRHYITSSEDGLQI